MPEEAGLLDPLQADLAQAQTQTYRARIAAMASAAEKDSLEQVRLEQLSERVTE